MIYQNFTEVKLRTSYIYKGLFINYVIRIGGRGLSQKMTQDDKGGGGGLGKDDG